MHSLRIRIFLSKVIPDYCYLTQEHTDKCDLIMLHRSIFFILVQHCQMPIDFT